MNKTRHYFQPMFYFDDGTNIDWQLPIELHSFEAFASEEDLIEFMASNGYQNGDYIINEYFDDDIEGVTILDCLGEVVETNEEN